MANFFFFSLFFFYFSLSSSLFSILLRHHHLHLPLLIFHGTFPNFISDLWHDKWAANSCFFKQDWLALLKIREKKKVLFMLTKKNRNKKKSKLQKIVSSIVTGSDENKTESDIKLVVKISFFLFLLYHDERIFLSLLSSMFTQAFYLQCFHRFFCGRKIIDIVLDLLLLAWPLANDANKSAPENVLLRMLNDTDSSINNIILHEILKWMLQEKEKIF